MQCSTSQTTDSADSTFVDHAQTTSAQIVATVTAFDCRWTQANLNGAGPPARH